MDLCLDTSGYDVQLDLSIPLRGVLRMAVLLK